MEKPVQEGHKELYECETILKVTIRVCSSRRSASISFFSYQEDYYAVFSVLYRKYQPLRFPSNLRWQEVDRHLLLLSSHLVACCLRQFCSGEQSADKHSYTHPYAYTHRYSYPFAYSFALPKTGTSANATA